MRRGSTPNDQGEFANAPSLADLNAAAQLGWKRTVAFNQGQTEEQQREEIRQTALKLLEQLRKEREP